MSSHLRPTHGTAWHRGGGGMALTFRCGVCDQPSNPSGRRQILVRGLKVYACKACMQQRAEKMAAGA